MPLEWDEVADCDPSAFRLATAPARFAERGDASAGIDSAAGSLDVLLDLSASQEAAGLGDALWPHYKKQRDEPPRVVLVAPLVFAHRRDIARSHGKVKKLPCTSR
jgi:bifunctional non-homologous end joining protein LigD